MKKWMQYSVVSGGLLWACGAWRNGEWVPDTLDMALTELRALRKIEPDVFLVGRMWSISRNGVMRGSDPVCR